MFNLFKKARQQEVATPEEPTPVVVSADITINGSVTGSIQSESDVLVEPKGYCVGSFVARELSIHGTVVGDVKANEIIIHPTGQLFFRKLSADNVVLHEGGVYAEQSDCLDEVILEPATEQVVEDLTFLSPSPPPPPVNPSPVTPSPTQPLIKTGVVAKPAPELTSVEGEEEDDIAPEYEKRDDEAKDAKKDKEDIAEKKRRKKGPTFVNTY